jgi:predicted acylesterase/phospholipase RssA
LLRAYLARFGLENALVPDSEGQRLVAAFGPIVDPQRTMRDFAEAGLDVRLTRANYRTGRLEISMYQSAESFLHYLSTHAWHLEQDWNRVAPLGSTRLQTAGNPNAIHAALASGRFPGVFAPFPVKEIYLDAPENRLTRLMLDSWLDSDEAEAALKVAYRKLHPTWNDETLEKRWQAAFATWRNSTVLRRLFPHHGDTYVDGGAIDNTPTNSAVDAMREWAARTNTSRRSFELDLYTVFLDPAQVPEFDAEERAPALYQVVQRTLALQSAATMPSDAVVVNTINTFGKRGEELGEQAAQLNAGLTAVLDGLDETLPDDMPDAERAAIEEALLAKMAAAMGLDGLTADKSKAKLRQIARRTNRLVNNYLPVHVNTVEIYPDSMPMGTLNFTERLGFRSENAIEMLTVGCYNTLWALRGYLENKRMQVEEDGGVLDSADSTALRLARKWMGFDDWPDEPATRHETWRCQRTQCAHYANACRHGRQQQP